MLLLTDRTVPGEPVRTGAWSRFHGWPLWRSTLGSGRAGAGLLAQLGKPASPVPLELSAARAVFVEFKLIPTIQADSRQFVHVSTGA